MFRSFGHLCRSNTYECTSAAGVTAGHPSWTNDKRFLKRQVTTSYTWRADNFSLGSFTLRRLYPRGRSRRI